MSPTTTTDRLPYDEVSLAPLAFWAKSPDAEILTRAPGLEVDEPVYLAGNVMRAIKSMPYRLPA